MFYSKLYKEHFPFNSPSDILSLNEEERALLIKYIKNYPGRVVDAIHRARKCGVKVEGDKHPGWIGMFLPSQGLADTLVELQQRSNELASKIMEKEPLSDEDVVSINAILYSNKYCPPVSWFVLPTLHSNPFMTAKNKQGVKSNE